MNFSAKGNPMLFASSPLLANTWHTLAENAWPLGVSLTAGSVAAILIDPGSYSLSKAVLIATALQIAIAICRGLFSERRDLLHTLKELLGEQREYLHGLIEKEKQERHVIANKAHLASLRLELLRSGIAYEDLPDRLAEPLYPEAEEGRS